MLGPIEFFLGSSGVRHGCVLIQTFSTVSVTGVTLGNISVTDLNVAANLLESLESLMAALDVFNNEAKP